MSSTPAYTRPFTKSPKVLAIGDSVVRFEKNDHLGESRREGMIAVSCRSVTQCLEKLEFVLLKFVPESLPVVMAVYLQPTWSGTSFALQLPAELARDPQHTSQDKDSPAGRKQPFPKSFHPYPLTTLAVKEESRATLQQKSYLGLDPWAMGCFAGNFSRKDSVELVLCIWTKASPAISNCAWCFAHFCA